MAQDRNYYTRRHGALELERSSWIEHWRELAKFVLPRSPRFLLEDQNKGAKRNNNILDSTATYALRTLASGMMSGITSTARPWFMLRTADAELNKNRRVREWLEDTRNRMSEAMLRSNVYTVFPRVYSDLGLYGTSAYALLEDQDTIFRAYHMPIGSYCLGVDQRNKVTTFYRAYQMTNDQLLSQFGRKRLSRTVQSAIENNQLDQWQAVVHAVERNQEAKPDALPSKFKRWRSVYYEKNGPAADSNEFLSERGFDEFPIIAPRWEVYGEDIYGSSPGMDTLADVKGLQLGQRRKGQVIDKFTDPPMNAPSSMQFSPKSTASGDVNFVDALQGGQGFTPTFQIANPHISELAADLAEIRGRINTAFYRDLFLMISQDDKTDRTATEIAARQEEKMLTLAPTYLRVNDEMLDPHIERTFQIMLRAGQIAPPPPELENKDLVIEYVSVMAQAMKQLGITGIERVMTFTGNLAQAFPVVIHKVDALKAVGHYADMVGVPPDMIVEDEVVQRALAQDAQDRQAAQMMENAKAGADAANKLANSPLSDNNALAQLLQRMGSGAGSIPQAPQLGGV